MEQQRSLNALQTYLALSKTANSPRAAAEIVTQATSNPHTSVFAELLHTQNIQALKTSPEHASYYNLLEIFAWGTWADYQSTPGLPALSPQQERKLRLLSLLSLAGNQANLTYASLQKALSLPDAPSLEKLVTTAIYSSMVTGTLDPAHQVANITSVAPLRDLAPGSIPTLKATLDQWSGQCTSTLTDLEAHIASVKEKARFRGQQEKKVQDELDKMVEDAASKDVSRPKRGLGAIGSGPTGAFIDDDDENVDAMDVDDNGRKNRSNKRGGFGMIGRFS
ncbi:cop9 signalosome subunit 7 [Venturia nashicola]|uniref:Cop9 signalosome subunit 7 n=1 Tax=Venturia nashicola TaxID=86259 RepID=A0A4Z1PC63_9PEZI|nr:cop9 signalosome subunit 7 [Venturia nashicola]TLD38860.1 cop9 signalosome subunit 7 [Venturia nashicola]